jgi:hypothetical protein
LPEEQKKIMTADGQVRISTVCLSHGKHKHQFSTADICGYKLTVTASNKVHRPIDCVIMKQKAA